MTVTPKIDPRKDGKPKKERTASMATTYAVWAIAAIAAVCTAGSVFVWREGRAPVAMAAPIQVPVPQVVANPNAEREINRLHDAVRVLATERDRLSTRLEQLERSVGDITAAIPQQKQKPMPAAAEEPPAAPTPPASQAAAPPNSEPRPQGHGQLMPVQPATPEAKAPETKASETKTSPTAPQVAATKASPPAAEQTQTTRTEFAIDLGGEKTVDGLRARWANLRGNHGAALDGMRPLIAVKEGSKSGAVELRLVAGPIANAAAAARVCARLQTSGVPCIPTVFDGQRLSLR